MPSIIKTNNDIANNINIHTVIVDNMANIIFSSLQAHISVGCNIVLTNIVTMAET